MARTTGTLLIPILVGLAIATAWFWPVIARADEPPGWLVEKVIRHESGGNARARGRHGEIGLMQIKCATAREVGFRGACHRLYEPATNRRYGSAYLAKAIRVARGNLCHALTLYNAGLGAKPRRSAYCRKVLR